MFKEGTIKAKMAAILSDGMPHLKDELSACLNDDLSPDSNVGAHLTAMRKVLRPLGQDIICQVLDHKFFYRWIRLLGNGKS